MPEKTLFEQFGHNDWCMKFRTTTLDLNRVFVDEKIPCTCSQRELTAEERDTESRLRGDAKTQA